MQRVVLEHGDEAARSKHPSHVADGNDGIRKGVETLGAPHEVERVVSKRQPVKRGDDEIDLCTPTLAGRLVTGFRDVGQIDVGPGDESPRPQPLGDAPSVESVAAGEVEHAHVGTEWQRIHDGLQLALERPVKSGELVVVFRQTSFAGTRSLGSSIGRG